MIIQYVYTPICIEVYFQKSASDSPSSSLYNPDTEPTFAGRQSRGDLSENTNTCLFPDNFKIQP